MRVARDAEAGTDAGIKASRFRLSRPKHASVADNTNAGQSSGSNASLRVLTVGPQGAGKTAVFGCLAPDGGTRATVTTIGFAVESAEIGSLSLTCWDVGDQAAHGSLTRRCFENVDVILFVLDASDPDALCEARSQLAGAVFGIASRSLPVVVAANKQDLPGALSAQKVAAALLLGRPGEEGQEMLHDIQLRVVATSATTGSGVEELISALASCATSRPTPQKATEPKLASIGSASRAKAHARGWMQPRATCVAHGTQKEEATFLARC